MLGVLCVALGVVGMFFPVLPTTPFLLLAAYLFVQSSSRFYHWLINNRWFGSYIRNYREGKGIPLKQKILTLALLWLSIGYAIGFVIFIWWGRLLLAVIAVGVTAHLVTIKNYKANDEKIAKEIPERRHPFQENNFAMPEISTF